MRNENERFIGWLVASPGNRMTRSYETAAWYDEFEIDAGCYPVYEHKGFNWAVCAARDLPATYVSGCRVSLYGGVAYGNDPAQANVGKKVRVDWSRQRNHYNRECSVFEATDYNGLRFIPVGPGNAEYGWTRVKPGRYFHQTATQFPSLPNSRRESITITRAMRLLPAPPTS